MKNSASSLNTYARCPQLWEYTYCDKLEPLDDGSFEASYGRAYHSLQEGDPDWAGNFGQKWAKIIETHYDCHKKFYEARPEWADLKVVAEEVKFSYEIAPGRIAHGIVDGVVEWNGEHYLIEYKTTGQELERWFEYKEHSIQPGLYILAGKSAPELQGYNIQGIILDVTRRCTLKHSKKESDQDYVNRCAAWWYKNRATSFERRLFQRDSDYLSELEYDILSTFDAQEQKHFPKHRENCFAFRKKCGWYDVCFNGESKTNSNLFQVRKRR